MSKRNENSNIERKEGKREESSKDKRKRKEEKETKTPCPSALRPFVSTLRCSGAARRGARAEPQLFEANWYCTSCTLHHPSIPNTNLLAFVL